MTSADSRPVAVLGGGIAGLVAARELRRHGVAVQVFEAGPHVAGMAASHTDPDGFSYDVGAHFVTNRFAAALGVAGTCRTVRRYAEVVPVDGTFHRYPLGLLAVPRFVASAAAARARAVRATAPPQDAAAWFRREYGSALADEVALPLLEAWSGVPASELSPAVGDKLPGSIAQTVFLRGAAAATRRAVAIGYCRTQPQRAGVYHVYPEGGTAAMCQKLADDLGPGVVRTHSPVETVHVENGRAVAVTVAGTTIPVAAVVNTAPIDRLATMVQGSDALEPFRAFRFRPLVMVNLKMVGANLLPDVLTWVPTGSSFFRLSEATQSMPWLAPPGRTMVLAEIGADIGDRWWTMDDDALITQCTLELERFVPDASQRLLGGRVLRAPYSYPVFLRSYEQDRIRLATEGTGVDGLISIGRNGEFDHILMEDIYWRTVRRIRDLVAVLRDPRQPTAGARSGQLASRP